MAEAPDQTTVAHSTDGKARRSAAGLFLIAALSALILLLIPIFAQEKPEAAKAQATGQAAAQEAKPAEAAKPAEYVGSETCQACHEDISKAFLKNPHHAVEADKRRGWDGKACESCHGPGSKHAESASAADIVNPSKAAPGKADQTCLKCHLNQPTHVGRIQGSHARNQVTCMSCHSIHKGPKALVARTAPEKNKQCASCHTSQWAQFNKPHHHRLTEGAMSCVDCHNPHGSAFGRNMQMVSANEPGCFKCHGDKRGPFLFEHAPVKLEPCTTCHEPHGSTNPRMLIRAEVRFVCLECHANLPTPSAATTQQTIGSMPPAFHDIRSPRFRNCTVCHQKIHGSYVDRGLTR